MTRRRRIHVALFLVAGILAACEGGTDPEGGPEVRVDTVGDTIRVHTISGSQWGKARELVESVRIGAMEGPDEEIFGAISGLAGAPDGGVYVYDRQVPVLRRYGPDGAFVETLGREGGGPGEYANSDGGMAVLPDGRLVLRDPGNARFTLFGPNGDYDTEWPFRGTHYTSQPLGVDTAGSVYTVVNRPPAEGEAGWPGGMFVASVLRIAPDGVTRDTLDIPRYAFDMEELSASSDEGSMTSTVPFTGGLEWAVHTSGGIITALGDRYEVDLHRPDGMVVRMMRNPEPVAVLAEEKAAAEERITRNMRRMAPDWNWNAASIPDTKAPIEGVDAGTAGRIWVRVPTPSERMPDEPREPGATEAPLPVFRAPPAWDVFEADGTYLGRVNGPAEMAVYPTPVFARDHVWAVVGDDLGVNYVVRFRIGAPAPTAGTGS